MMGGPGSQHAEPQLAPSTAHGCPIARSGDAGHDGSPIQ
jgi:hypothetical protein